jgi:hypothetical protein
MIVRVSSGELEIGTLKGRGSLMEPGRSIENARVSIMEPGRSIENARVSIMEPGMSIGNGV